jgi:hypothetical protein
MLFYFIFRDLWYRVQEQSVWVDALQVNRVLGQVKESRPRQKRKDVLSPLALARSS